MAAICSEANCTRNAHTRGMCNKHYMQWRRTADGKTAVLANVRRLEKSFRRVKWYRWLEDLNNAHPHAEQLSKGINQFRQLLNGDDPLCPQPVSKTYNSQQISGLVNFLPVPPPGVITNQLSQVLTMCLPLEDCVQPCCNPSETTQDLFELPVASDHPG